MLPYWLLFGFYALGAVFHKIQPREASRLGPVMIAGLAAMALMIGMRYQVGADWKNYLDIFKYTADIPTPTLVTIGDPGYLLLNRLAQNLDYRIWFVNSVCAVVFVLGLTRFAKRQPNPWLSVTVAIPYLVIVVAMGYTRQGVAIGLLMAAVVDFQDGKYVRFTALFLLSAMFHKSALLVLPLVVLAAVRYRFMIVSGAAIMAAALFSLLVAKFESALYANYLEQDLNSQGAGIRVLMNLVPAILFLLFQRRIVLNEAERLMWRNFSFATLASAVSLLFLPSTVVDRVALYLIPLQILVLGRLPYAFPQSGRKRNEQVMVGVLLYSVAVQLVWLVFAQHAEYWVPYQFGPGS